jgi:hypothetical protein
MMNMGWVLLIKNGVDDVVRPNKSGALLFFSCNKKVRTCISVKSRGASILLSENVNFPHFKKV